MERHICHDCGCREGEIHEFGCDIERCPFCGGQLISCDCVYEKLNLDCSLGSYTYEHGLTKEQEERWLKILTERGRRRYIQYPNICIYCGKLWPEMFSVSDEEWEKYIDPDKRGEMICKECWDWIKEIQDERRNKR